MSRKSNVISTFKYIMAHKGLFVTVNVSVKKNYGPVTSVDRISLCRCADLLGPIYLTFS